MKQKLKELLIKYGLLDSMRLVYHSVRSFSLQVFFKEYFFRHKSLPDGYPAPPSRLIFLIIGLPWASVYYYSGKEIFEEMRVILEKNKISIHSFDSILDFGCGSGRIIRHFIPYSKKTALYGADYNQELVGWCINNLPFAQFQTNTLAPPLQYGNSMFDFLYARSVFTHLSFDLQKEWMAEFRRIMRKGGYLYITTHGEKTFSKFTGTEKSILERDGILTLNQKIEGDNKCSTYQTKEYFTNNLLHDFEIIDFIPGGNTTNLRQDIYLLRKA